MAVTKYTYSIASDITSGKLGPKLQDEIAASSIVTALDNITSSGDVLDVSFKDALSAGDKTTLDTVVQDHDSSAYSPDPTTVTFEKLSPVTSLPKFIAMKMEGSSGSIASHDWTDPCTWYNDSVRVTGETLDLVIGKTYAADNSPMIDLVHGRVSDEDDISASYLVKVYDNAVEKTEGTDYTVNYETGQITFDVGYTVTGPVTADYSYENGSTFVVKPQSGKRLDLEHAELQFSANIDLNGSYIDFDIYVYNPLDLPNKILYKRKRYKGIKDILNSANLGQGKIQAVDSLTQDILVFPFNYVTVQSLLDSQGAEMRISINDDQAFGGEWATATFYIMSEDE